MRLSRRFETAPVRQALLVRTLAVQ